MERSIKTAKETGVYTCLENKSVQYINTVPYTVWSSKKFFANLFSHVTHAGCTVIKCFHYKENSKQTMGIQYTCTYILKVEQSCICI